MQNGLAVAVQPCARKFQVAGHSVFCSIVRPHCLLPNGRLLSGKLDSSLAPADASMHMARVASLSAVYICPPLRAIIVTAYTSRSSSDSSNG